MYKSSRAAAYSLVLALWTAMSGCTKDNSIEASRELDFRLVGETNFAVVNVASMRRTNALNSTQVRDLVHLFGSTNRVPVSHRKKSAVVSWISFNTGSSNEFYIMIYQGAIFE